MFTQLNLGSPVTKVQKDKLIQKALPKPKRPNSAKCHVDKNQNDQLCSTLLSSTHGIHRKGFKINLASALFSKPEVESNHIPSERWPSRKTSRVSSANRPRRTHALVTVQKFMRGYLAKIRVNKKRNKELIEMLKNEEVQDEDGEEVGEGLTISDLECSQKRDNLKHNFKRNKKTINENMISEVVYNPSDSKLENTQTMFVELFNREGQNPDTKQQMDSRILDNTLKNAQYEDDRDLNRAEMKMHLQDSPLTRILPEDEISVISSRIESNRKRNLQNSTIEILNSTRKNNLKDESVRIVESIKKNKQGQNVIMVNSKYKKEFEVKNPILENEEEYDVRNTASINFKKVKECVKADGTWRQSLSYLKKNAGMHKDSADAALKSHKSKAHNQMVPKKGSDAKKRPGSAGLKQNKPLDIAKMQASLQLLKKNIEKSHKSTSSQKEVSEEIINPTERGPVVRSKIIENNLDPSQFKRPSGKIALSKRKLNTQPMNISEILHKKPAKDLTKTPTKVFEMPEESPNIAKMRKIYGSEKGARRNFKREKVSVPQSMRSDSRGLGESMDSMEVSALEDSALDNTMYEVKYPKAKEMLNALTYKYKDIREEAIRKKKESKSRLKQNKINQRKYEEEIQGIKRWMSKFKNKIKSQRKSFIELISTDVKFDVDATSSRVFNAEESKQISSRIIEESNDFLSANKFYNSATKDKNNHTGFDLSSSNILRCTDMMNNSHISIMNSAVKNHSSKKPKPIHKQKENNMSIDSSKCIKITQSKDKHLYGITPFEYKSKPTLCEKAPSSHSQPRSKPPQILTHTEPSSPPRPGFSLTRAPTKSKFPSNQVQTPESSLILDISNNSINPPQNGKISK